MADKEKYMIKVEGKLVEVTPDVYYAYFRMERQERWQEEKQQGHAVMSYAEGTKRIILNAICLRCRRTQSLPHSSDCTITSDITLKFYLST